VKHALLVPHPTSNVGALTHLEVGVNLGPRLLRLSYKLEGDLSKLRLPVDTGPRRGAKLWEHTCFEAFLRNRDQSAYYEFNFSPSREWEAMQFKAYRDGGPMTQEPVTQVLTMREDRLLRVEAMILLDRLPAPPARPLQIGLSAVVEERTGAQSYWALKHPDGRPDFHHADSFALELA